MLFFIDESWQTTFDKRFKIGVLSAIHLKSHDFNMCSSDIFNLKLKHLGYGSVNTELKGNELLKNYFFKLEKRGIRSNALNLVRDLLDYIHGCRIQFFASVVMSQQEIDLACGNANQLERPFFFLFERIDLFMKENYPGLMAKLIFDDRGVQSNERISKSVSNFFHKSKTGQAFDTIIKVPFFAISSENIGIQMADIGAYIVGARFTGDKRRIEFFKKIKELEFVSKLTVDVNGKQKPLKGIKVVK